MIEKENYHFYETDKLTQTHGIRERCRIELLEAAFRAQFPDEKIQVIKVDINETGVYKKKRKITDRLLGFGKNITGLPSFCEVQLKHQTGRFSELIIVWTPLAWNDRFAGTAGGGTSTGGMGHLRPADSTTRGWSLPYAIINGFTAATADAGNTRGSKDLMLDPETKEIRQELYENWRVETTHWMTLCGKTVAETLHQRPVKYAYMNGGSGGGRQAMMEAQEYPEDYDGIWASCPAINWTKFAMNGLWAIAVMNTYNHVLTAKKIRYFTEKVWESAGGREAYDVLEHKVEFDPRILIGKVSKGGGITELDAEVMDKIWNGPEKQDGMHLWYGFRPGVIFWNVGIPIGAFYYTFIRKRVKPFVVSTAYARWITQDPGQRFTSITIPEFEQLYENGLEKFYNAAGDKADLSAFAAHGGKLLIDHGLKDPLIPVDGTIDYYKNMCRIMGGKQKVDAFCRLYLTPGEGHGNCWGDGPGITESAGMSALIQWVEQGQVPEALRAVRVDKKTGEIVQETVRRPVVSI